MNDKEDFTIVITDIIKKSTDLTLENIILKKKLKIALECLRIYADTVDEDDTNFYSIPKKMNAKHTIKEINNIKESF